MSGKIDCTGLSHLPTGIEINPDEFLIGDLNRSLRIHETSLEFDNDTRLFGNSRGKVLIVADGVGSDRSASRASTLAVDAVSNYVLNSMRVLARQVNPATGAFLQQLKAALAECQHALNTEGEAFDDHRGMAANITIAFILWPQLFVIQVGNGRCYLMRDTRLNQLIAPENSTTTSVVGGSTEVVSPQTRVETLRVGDRLLIATNGLHQFVSETVIAETLRDDSSAEEKLDHLVRKAVENGSDDAVTAILTCFGDGNPPRPAGPAALRTERAIRKRGATGNKQSRNFEVTPASGADRRQAARKGEISNP